MASAPAATLSPSPAVADDLYGSPRVAYRPHARQQAVHDAPEPEVWAACGYAVGKTTLAVWEAFSLATVTHPGYAGIVAAPTFPLLFQSWVTEWERAVPRACWSLRRDPLFGAYLAVPTAAGESRVWLRSTTNAESLEGINAAWLVFDEATRERSHDPIRVLASRVRRGHPGRVRRQLIIGPPQTRSHWTAVDFGTGPDASREGDALSWSDRTRRVVRARTRDNPHLPPSFERDLRSRPGATRAWCRQWLDAEFGAIEGQIYEAFSRDVHVIPAAQLKARQWADVVAGVDWGWSKLGALVVLGVDGRGDAYVIHEECHARKNVDDTPGGWLPILHRVCRDLRVRRMFCDPSRPGDIDAAAKKLRGVTSVYPADNDVAEGIRRCAARFEWAAERAKAAGQTGAHLVGRLALYVSDACAHTIGELEGYARRKERDGSFGEAPDKRDDHAMDAMRYAEMGVAAR
jgi:hypothetical protein